jgi:hypothetical protein
VTDDPQGVSKRTDGSVTGVGDDDPNDANRTRPLGMLPRGVSRKETPEANRQFVMDLAEALHPGVDHIDQLGDADRKSWITTAGLFLRDDLVDRLFAKFGKELAPAVQAEVEDILARREFDFDNERERIDREVREQDEKRRIEDEHWEVEKEERLTLLRNRSRRETAVLAMAVVVTALVVTICVVALAEHQVVVVGGFAGLLAIAFGVVFRQLRQDQKEGTALMASIRPPAP